MRVNLADRLKFPGRSGVPTEIALPAEPGGSAVSLVPPDRLLLTILLLSSRMRRTAMAISQGRGMDSKLGQPMTLDSRGSWRTRAIRWPTTRLRSRTAMLAFRSLKGRLDAKRDRPLCQGQPVIRRPGRQKNAPLLSAVIRPAPAPATGGGAEQWPGRAVARQERGRDQFAGVVAQPRTTRIFASMSACTKLQVLGQRLIMVGAAGLS